MTIAVNLFAACVLLLSGCASLAIRNIDAADAMKQVLLAEISPGTSLTDAKKTMRKYGFKCEIRRNDSFYEHDSFLIGERRHENIDFLMCKRLVNAGLLVVKIWYVAIVLDGDIVKDILVTTYLDGP